MVLPMGGSTPAAAPTLRPPKLDTIVGGIAPGAYVPSDVPTGPAQPSPSSGGSSQGGGSVPSSPSNNKIPSAPIAGPDQSGNPNPIISDPNSQQGTPFIPRPPQMHVPPPPPPGPPTPPPSPPIDIPIIPPGFLGTPSKPWEYMQQAAASTNQGDIALHGAQGAMASAAETSQTSQEIAEAAQAAGAGYDTGLGASLGGSASDYARRATESARAQASEEAARSSIEASKAAVRTARAMGLNPGEAALSGAQSIGDTYTDAYSKALGQGQALYGQGTSMIGAAGSDMANRIQAALGTQLGAGNLAAGNAQAAQGQQNQQQNQQNQQNRNIWGAISAAIGALLSDKRVKQRIRDLVGQSDKFAQVAPKTFEYKPEIGNPGEKSGVMAQDLEAAGLGDMVREGPGGVKMIDTNAAISNILAAVSDLSRKFKEMEGK